MGGLMEALVCTAAGLAVAVPCYAAFNFLVGRVEKIVSIPKKYTARSHNAPILGHQGRTAVRIQRLQQLQI